MLLPLFRSVSAPLLHALLWGLVAVLLVAQQPDYLGPKPSEFRLTQAVMFGLLVGVFCANVAWVAPRLLYGRQVWTCVVLNAVAVLAVHQQVAVRLGVSELVTTAREAVLNPSNPWSDSYPLSGIKESSTLVNPGVLLIALLVRDIVTSLAAMQKGPRIIFTTAFNQYAQEGFRVDALDYLFKPFNYEEFWRAALKAQVFFEMKPAGLVLAPVQPEEDHIYLKVEYKLVRVVLVDFST